MHAFEAQDIRKSYGGVHALRGVGLAVRPGSVHALLGENGAGKSTLVKIMTGVTRPDSGVLRLDGREVAFANTAEAAENGVAVVSQELSLFPHLSLLSNLFPMREPRKGLLIDKREMLRRAEPILDQLGVDAAPGTLVQELSLADRQLVEIAKALVTEPRVLLLDEPTSALEGGATDRLLDILRVLRSRDVGVVFVSHILQEVMSVCDEVTVLRDGAMALSADPIANHSVPTLVKAMIGDKVVATETVARTDVAELAGTAEGALVVDGLALGSGVHDVNLTVKPGEIVGLVGLAGSGPTDVLRALAGIVKPTAGTVTLPGGRPAPKGHRAHVAAGVAYVSGDRRRYGLMLEKPIWENMVQVRSMGMSRDGAFLRKGALLERARGHVARVGIKVGSLEDDVSSLSGGNQQKVVMAKWLDNAPSVLLLDDPTRGVDVGARAEIHGLLRGASNGGSVVLMCSTDLEEVVAACDRVVVFYRGRPVAELVGPQITTRTMLELVNTGAPEEQAA
ncbi:sugar ABC transporter ATP-binding protein [Demequina sp. SYSU T00192]|uniref:Sugar ABC transporter ATP-binding protein n=1 Tax=Demequina litoralis TaxID=3051660 RepID=A0ABT8G8X3_9MICO|nr:sugar ABC transporter ATP-binding protein [Demequina sp. SYSU T00192]MDN4475512.1 sugar ABC transporter ATP-binding protein [Demequina sp. SYSU T00192]